MTRSRTLRRLAVAAAVAATVGLVAAPAGAASDSTIAKAGVITTSDVPATWTSTPSNPSSDKQVEKAAAKISVCKDYLAARKLTKGAAHAQSRDFSDGLTPIDDTLSNEVWVFPNAAAAKKTFAAMGKASIDNCLTTLFQQQLEASSGVQDVTVQIQQLTDLPAIGDEAIGYAGGTVITGTDGSVQQIILGNFLVRQGRTVASYTLSGPATATGIDTSFQTAFDSAVNASVDRIQQAS